MAGANRKKPLFINGVEITDPVAIRLSGHMTEARAAFVHNLRNDREYTWRMIAEECANQWSKDWPASQDIGQALCRLASATLGEEYRLKVSTALAAIFI